jgi:hypothetical protein
MKLIPIFVNKETGEGLYSIRYVKGLDEYSKLLNQWNDIEFIENYFHENRSFLSSEYFQSYQMTIDMAIDRVLDEADALASLIYDFVNSGFKKKGKNLQMIFKPLHNKQYEVPKHQATKAKIEDKRKFPGPLLRIYGIRIDRNTFVITGGAIKLTRLMEEHTDTKRELEKISIVKSFLSKNGINTIDDITYYYEEQ